MNDAEELAALRRMAELEDKASGASTRIAGRPKEAPINPTEGNSFLENARIGMGKGFTDIAQGAKQWFYDTAATAEKYGPKPIWNPLNLRMPSDVSKELTAETTEKKRLDAPISKTGGGMFGDIVANVAASLPLAMIPGAGTIRGGALLGGVMGQVAPVAEGESRLKNTGVGAAFGAAVPATLRVAKATKAALIDPFTEAGKQRIVAGLANRVAENGETAAANMRTNVGSTPGFSPTAGQASNDAGIAALERTARASDPGGFGAVDKSQTAALVDSLRKIAGSPEAKAEQLAKVEETAKKLYGEAFKESTPVTPELQRLAGKPSMQAAEARAKKLAAELSIPFRASLDDMRPKMVPVDAPRRISTALGDAPEISIPIDAPENIARVLGRRAGEGAQAPEKLIPLPKNENFATVLGERPKISVENGNGAPRTNFMGIPPVDSVPVRDMHTLKMAMDAMLSDPTLGIAGREAAAQKATRNKLLDLLPESYQTARKAHIELNKPVHQMDIGEELYKRFVPALADSAVPFKSTASRLADAVRNGDKLAKNVTGMKNAKFDEIMTPEQIKAIQGVIKDAQLKVAAETAGRGVGSDSAQKFAMSHIMAESGIPNWIQNIARVPGGMLKTAGNLLYSSNDQSIRNTMADMLKDPQVLAAAMQKAGASPSRIAEYLRISAQAPVTALPAIMQGTQE